MIEKNTGANLAGQTELSDLMGTETGDIFKPASRGTIPAEEGNGETAEGYDTEGNLINPGSADLMSAERLNALAVEIRTIEGQVKAMAMAGALEIGRRLIEAKALCPEGRWLEWIGANLDYSERRAQDMMRLYEQYGRGTVPEAVSALDYSKAVALLAAPEEQREALAGRALDEGLSVRQLQDEIKKLRRQTGDQQLVIDGLKRENDSVRDDGTALEAENDRLAEALKEAEQAARVAEEKAKQADARAVAAEESAKAAEESVISMRKVSGKAVDEAAASAQRASDAVNRANETARKLAEARTRIEELERQTEPKTVEKVVEVVPEAVQKELRQLRADLAEAQAKQQTAAAPTQGATAVDKFKWFYSNQMQPAFSTALKLLKDVASEDGHAANMFATALVSGCKRLMEQLGVES